MHVSQHKTMHQSFTTNAVPPNTSGTHALVASAVARALAPSTALPTELSFALPSSPVIHRLHEVDHVLRRHVARRPGTVRAAAQAAHAAVERPDAVLQRHRRVDQRLPVRVVEVHRNVLAPDARRRHALEQCAGPWCRAHARRVAQRDLVRARLEQVRGDLSHLVRVDVESLERAAQDDGDVGAHPQPERLGVLDHGLEALQRRLYIAVEVLLREALGRGREDGHLDGWLVVRVQLAREGAGVLLEDGGRVLQAFRVWCQERPGHRNGGLHLLLQKVLHDLARVGHLPNGDPFGRNERPRLNSRNACSRKALNQVDFCGERDNCLLVLQAIARSDLDELHPVAASGLLRASCREASSQLELGSPAGPAHSRSKESHRELARLPAPTLL
ncbi:hypothetical protein VFPFJ_07102 [Purpureocillium lilacinum]|uniref:Uncharacterized protein n=1 Tax=Purpureocillium lilacinum TaxID=33203 RepID=A0A179HEJ0_PURLI|nr:hypothetical protein VFPFJ_07102 [Purpureocillium lilacinum]OAQ88637.1 hypothetical protein VFPFJ_07102 [Purpureocillium lilacinum]